MPEHVRRAVVEKINHTRQGLQRTKWKPTEDVYICNVHYPDFIGPRRGYPDVLPIYFKRPTSYPTTISAPKKRKLLERRLPAKKSLISKVSEQHYDQLHSLQPCQFSEGSHSELHSMEMTECTSQSMEMAGEAPYSTEITESTTHSMEMTEYTSQNTEMAEESPYNTEATQETPRCPEMAEETPCSTEMNEDTP